MRTAIAIVLLAAACGSGDKAPPPPPPVAPIADAAPAEPPPGESKLLADFAPGALADDKVAALSVAVLAGDAIGARAFGVLARDQTTAATDETRFEAGAIARGVTAVAVLRLVDQHRLDLDADIVTHVKRPHPGLTLRALLSDPADLDPAVYFHPALGGYPPGRPLPTAAQLLARLPADDAGGYTLVQQIVEDVTKQPFADAMRDLVLAPAGMVDSTFADAPGGNDYARGHDRDGAPLPTMTGYYAVAEKAAGGLWTTPRDLARLLRELVRAANGEPNALFAGADHGRALAAAMLKPEPSQDAGDTRALGWFSTPAPDRRFSNRGHTPGFRATLVADLTMKTGLVVMANADAEAPVFAHAVAALAERVHTRH